MSDPRTLRQRLVVEIGEAGQARIGAARALVRGEGLAAEVERRYLEGAGFAAVEAAPGEAEPPAIAEALRPLALDASAEAVVHGAARALAQIRAAAEVPR